MTERAERWTISKSGPASWVRGNDCHEVEVVPASYAADLERALDAACGLGAELAGREEQLEERNRDIRAIRRQIEVVEEAADSLDEGRFMLFADDMQALGWGRVLCDNALASTPQEVSDGG